MKIKRFFQNVLKPLFRGLIKTVPMGGAIIEAIDNVKKESQGETLNHNWVSIITQIIVLGVLVYLVVSKQIDLNEFIEQVKNY